MMIDHAGLYYHATVMGGLPRNCMRAANIFYQHMDPSTTIDGKIIFPPISINIILDLMKCGCEYFLLVGCPKLRKMCLQWLDAHPEYDLGGPIPDSIRVPDFSRWVPMIPWAYTMNLGNQGKIILHLYPNELETSKL